MTQAQNQANHILTIVALQEGEKPYLATADAALAPLRKLDLFTATKEELEQARTDLNNSSIKQDFDDNKDRRNIRAELHALILNRLGKIQS